MTTGLSVIKCYKLFLNFFASGFFSTGDRYSAGNYGMFDQVKALKFVKANIKSFRGNPDKITIMGHSAGAASVGMHILSPRSVGEFIFVNQIVGQFLLIN